MFTFYHNPRCSKSRQALALLEEKNVRLEVVRYLETPPDKASLAQLVKKLGITPRQLMRTGEDAYKSLQLDDDALSDNALLEAMSQHPKLIERPILIGKKHAVIGRPPERVLTLLE